MTAGFLPPFGDIMAMPTAELQARAKTGLRIHDTTDALFDAFAREIADEIAARNARHEPTRLILPVGPIAQYPRLVAICNRERISWRNVFTFNMDEWLDWQGRPVPTTHPLSFEGYMRRSVFDALDPELRIPDAQIVFPHPFRIDDLSERIREVGGIDTCYGGIGFHGHVAFNEPPDQYWTDVSLDDYRSSTTRVVALRPDTLVVNGILSAGGHFMAVPPLAVTIGMREILDSRRLRFYVFAGARHRAILRIALLGDVSVRFPVTFLQEHLDCVISADAVTAQPVRPGYEP